MNTEMQLKQDWAVNIGLEIHAQIKTKSKLFSHSSTEFGAIVNSNVSLFDASIPGTLPVLNGKCIEQIVKTGLALGAKINLFSVFDRKHYFYPDLPHGYQITQFWHPIVGKGNMSIEMVDENDELKSHQNDNNMIDSSKDVRLRYRNIGITRIHLEQDAGKSIHDQSATDTLIDLNRSGVALMEIVTEPDIISAEEAGVFMKKLRTILRYIGTCDGDMEKGSMRCDANVSVRKKDDTQFGTRAEIKNLNSIKNIIRAINFEITRQIKVIESGAKVIQETRLFDDKNGQTKRMRSKEEANDYRYFPDPDLLPVVISTEYVQALNAELPELPDQKLRRYIQDLKLNKIEAETLSLEKAIADYFETVLIDAKDVKIVANWMTTELFSYLNKTNTEINECKIKPLQFAQLTNMIIDGIISGKIAKNIFEIMFNTGADPIQIMQKEGLEQITDNSEIYNVISEIMHLYPKEVALYKQGKEKLFGFFIGEVMKHTKGRANPSNLHKILKEKLTKNEY